MRKLVRFTLTAVALCLALSPVLAGLPASATAQPRRIPVVFNVVNRNGSALPCSSDGRSYELHGDLVVPATGIPQTVTLALHEFSFGRFFWTFGAAPAYDYAAHLSRAGHATLAIDRLGYDRSGHPAGTTTCLGAQADTVAQVVRALRAGTYTAAGHRPPAFPKIFVAGHSVGGGIAELAAHSFPDLRLAGLMLLGWADTSYSNSTVRQFADQRTDCTAGGEPAEPGMPSGYAWFARTEAAFQRNMFFDADWSVMRAATALRNRDPCGDNATLVQLAFVNRMGVKSLAIPVLLLFGAEDPVFQDGAAQQQAAMFSASPRVTVRELPRTAHAMTLERSAPTLRAHAIQWLRDPLRRS